MDYMLLIGFKTARWPLDTSIVEVFNNFANRNDVFVSLYNTTVRDSSINDMQNVTYYIQVSYHATQNYGIHDIFCPGFHFSELDIWLDTGYANSIAEYFSLLTKFECAFCGWYDANNIMQKITNADNALVEYDLCIKDK